MGAERVVGFTLSSLGIATSAAFTDALAPLGLAPRDFALMRAIETAEGLPQHTVGERLRIPPSRMVAFVDTLEQRGLVERRADPSDRRARALHLTDAGRELMAEALRVAIDFERHLCEGLEVKEREQLLELLQRVGKQLGVPPGVHAAHAQPPSDERHGAAKIPT